MNLHYLLNLLKRINKTYRNTWFSAMPADDYALIVPFACHLQSGLDE